MPDDETRSERYRRLAGECLAVANTMPSGEGRSTLLEMTLVWHRLADDYADSAMSSLSPAEPEQPVMQQPQQIQPNEE